MTVLPENVPLVGAVLTNLSLTRVPDVEPPPLFPRGLPHGTNAKVVACLEALRPVIIQALPREADARVAEQPLVPPLVEEQHVDASAKRHLRSPPVRPPQEMLPRAEE